MTIKKAEHKAPLFREPAEAGIPGYYLAAGAAGMNGITNMEAGLAMLE